MTLALSYFDYDGSRGLECRLALNLAGLPFEDQRIQRDQWMSLKPTTPFGAVPVLSRDGQALAHSTAILTWIGRSNGLHPADPWRAAEHEGVMNAVEDLRAKVPGGRELSDDEKRTAREAFAAGWLSQWSATISGTITGPFLDGDHLQVADLKLYTILRAFAQGGYDHLPWSVFDAWPKIQDFYVAVDTHPTVQAFFAAR